MSHDPTEHRPGSRVLLLDADGVVQVNAPGWLDRLRAFAPDPARADDLVEALFAAEHEALCGRRRFADVVEDVATGFGVPGPTDRLVDLWRHAVPQPDVLALVEELRATGTACWLATNQNDVRAAHLREALGYEALFDGLLVSCELGTTKDDPAFFARALERVGVPPARALLVDDSAGHLDRAREAGVVAVRWEVGDGVDALRERLAAHGLPVAA